MGAPRMIPFLITGIPLQAALLSGLLIVIMGLLGTAVFLCLAIALRAEQYLYPLSLLLLLPCTGLSIVLPLILHSGFTPLLQGILLLPLLVFPLSLPIKTLQPSWFATAQELGANTQARLRFFWWPLLQKAVLISLFLSFTCSIVQ